MTIHPRARAGLLLFGTEPYIQAPLTFDLGTVKTLLDESGIGMAGRATAIGDAIGLAVKRLRDRPQDQRVLYSRRWRISEIE